MNTDEYLKYFNLIQGAEVQKIILGDSIDEISKIRLKASISFARVASELGRVKDSIDLEFLRLMASPEAKAGRSEIEAEAKINSMSEVSRRDLESLLKGIEHFMNACSGRQRALESDFKSTQNS